MIIIIYLFLERCNMSSKVHSTELKTIGDKNYFNPQAFLPSRDAKDTGNVKIKRGEKSAQRGNQFEKQEL